MHDEASEFVRRYGSLESLSVIEIGSRNINGSAREHFPHASWIGLDIRPGEGVDIVTDAEFYEPEATVDLVICCEVFEHTDRWRQMIGAASRWLNPGGRLLVTCAGPGRHEHSAEDGEHRLRPGEHYANISQQEMGAAFESAGFVNVHVSGSDVDTYCIGQTNG